MEATDLSTVKQTIRKLQLNLQSNGAFQDVPEILVIIKLPKLLS